jgi:hypothetical protein
MYPQTGLGPYSLWARISPGVTSPVWHHHFNFKKVSICNFSPIPVSVRLNLEKLPLKKWMHCKEVFKFFPFRKHRLNAVISGLPVTTGSRLLDSLTIQVVAHRHNKCDKIGRFFGLPFSLDSFENYRSSLNVWVFFSIKRVVLILTKNGLGYNLGDAYFHKLIWSPWLQLSSWRWVSGVGTFPNFEEKRNPKVVLNMKKPFLNSTHARLPDGILAYQKYQF